MNEQELAQQPPSEYVFTDEERGSLTGIRTQILLAKEKIYELNVQLEAEQKNLAKLQALHQGGLEITGSRMKMAAADLAPDYSKLIRRG